MNYLLIVDDSPFDSQLARRLLEKTFHERIKSAVNGWDALELIEEQLPLSVITDLQMPVLNGFDAAMEIRKMRDPKKANTPIIALTASALFDIKERVFNSGMNDYVSKPFKPDELREKMQNLVAAFG